MPTKKIASLIILAAGITLAILPFIRERPDSTRKMIPLSTSIQPAQNPNTETNTPQTNEATSTTQQPAPPAAEKFFHAKLIIDDKSYDLEFREGEALYDALSRLSKTGAITVGGHEFSGLGYFIDALNGKRAAGGYSWVYAINGVKSSLGVSSYKVRENDLILWTYEKAY